MSVNKYLPHVLILPEDDANRELANGFQLQIEANVQRCMQVLPVAGGWIEVLNAFKADHVPKMEAYPNRVVILLIDFDGQFEQRIKRAKRAIPPLLRDRVFVLGVSTEPEALKGANLGSYEEIGAAMALDCANNTAQIWDHDLLRHNSDELDRLRPRVCPILFS